MNRPLTILCLLLATCVADAKIDFANDVAPIFAEHCTKCHGEEKQKGALRLDSPEGVARGGDSGEPLFVAGNSEQSHLIRLVTGAEPDLQMPPKGEPLPAAKIAILRQWIDAGAVLPKLDPNALRQTTDHWSFQPLKRPTPPASDDTWIRNPIDAFVLATLKAKGLSPSPRADDRQLTRRLHQVMLGLPPSEQTDTDAPWAEQVKTALASPHYGERWASHWLDLARFGETHGFEMNRERPEAWPYRDYVIAAFNDDKPYDQFVREQIAGDSVGAPIGTSFLVAGPVDQVKGQDPMLRLVQRQNELDDMINTTGTAFLGLTTGCARCHNHKFDPISQTDYFAMQAVLAGVRHSAGTLPETEADRQRKAELDARIGELRKQLLDFVPAAKQDPFVAIADDEAEHLQKSEGTGNNPKGPEPNLSGGAYTWWTNKPGQPVAAYPPRVEGQYRIWLSWGAGYKTHSTDARYRIGDREIARVNQQLWADGSGKVDSTRQWSGLYDAGVHTLTRSDSLVLVGGDTGKAITADIVFFQKVDDPNAPALPPGLRPPISATHNLEVFAPREAKFVRFRITATNGAQACIDELEIFCGDRNVALEGKASSNGDFVHPLHKLAQINDGHYGNAKSWIAAKNSGWVQIALPEITRVDRIEWARDREGKYADRLATDYRIETATEAGKWEFLCGSVNRKGGSSKESGPIYRFDGLPEAEARRGKDLLAQLKAAQKSQGNIQRKAYIGAFSQPGATHRLYRGEPNQKREVVTPGGIAILADLGLAKDSPEKARRLALANWIASADNPLTARVMVNRLWQFQFGTGLVDTPSDFGANGTPPSHPDLLDWLAAEFIDSGWSVKHIQRLILESNTWQQSSHPRSDALAKDGASRLLWRFPPRRLEAEGIRDSICLVSGVLDTRMGGPGFSPFAVQKENVRHYHPKEDYGPEDWSRMIYMTKVRQEREQVFGVFDCPDASQVMPTRSRSTTPLQALNLLNSRFVLQQADLLAKRLQSEAPEPPAQIIRAWQLLYGRAPDTHESRDALVLTQAHGLPALCRALLNSNEFLFIF
jgi:hypothetical protein